MEIIQENLSGAIRLCEQGKYERAVPILEKVVVNHDARDVRPLLRLGEAYARLDRVGDAIRTYETAGQRLSKMGFHKNAVAVYKQLLDVTNRPRDAHLALAVEYEQLGFMADAQMHRRAASVEPTRAFQLAEAETATMIKVPSLGTSTRRGTSKMLVGMLVGAAVALLVSSGKLDQVKMPSSTDEAVVQAEAQIAGASVAARAAAIDLAWRAADFF